MERNENTERNNGSAMNILAGYVFCSSPRNLKNEDVVVEEKEKSDRIMPEIENNYDTIDTHNQSPGLAASETADSGIFNLIINTKSTGDETIEGNRFQSQFSTESHQSTSRGYPARSVATTTTTTTRNIRSTENDKGKNRDTSESRMSDERIISNLADTEFKNNANVETKHPSSIEIPSSPLNSRGEVFEDHPDNEVDNNQSSPKQRMNHIAAPYSPREFENNKNTNSREEFEDNPLLQVEHIGCLHRGVFKTLFPIIMAIAAFSLSVACKYSVDFVTLDIPLDIGGHLEEVDKVGLFFIEICRADEIVTVDYSNDLVTISSFAYADNDAVFEEPIDTVINQVTTSDYDSRSKLTIADDHNDDQNNNLGNSVCEKIRLESGVVGDGLWNFARIVAGMTEWMGGFLTLVLICSCFWRTMNLIPVGIGLLVTYTCQGLVFVFFETRLCKDHGCFHSQGTYIAVSALVFWFFSWVGVLNMIVQDRHERRVGAILTKKREIAAAIYDKKRNNKKRSFLHNQFSFMKLFSNSRRQVGNNMASGTCDTTGSDEPACEPGCGCCRLEI
jgi:hypothetical protein